MEHNLVEYLKICANKHYSNKKQWYNHACDIYNYEKYRIVFVSVPENYKNLSENNLSVYFFHEIVNVDILDDYTKYVENNNNTAFVFVFENYDVAIITVS